MKSFLRGILPGTWINDKGEVINTTKIYIDYENTDVKGLIGNQVSEIRYSGDISKLTNSIGKQVNLMFIPSGKSVKLADIQVVL